MISTEELLLSLCVRVSLSLSLSYCSFCFRAGEEKREERENLLIEKVTLDTVAMPPLSSLPVEFSMRFFF